jgi:hypothetical protein
VIKNDPPRIGTSQQAARHKRTTTTAAILHWAILYSNFSATKLLWVTTRYAN